MQNKPQIQSFWDEKPLEKKFREGQLKVIQGHTGSSDIPHQKGRSYVYQKSGLSFCDFRPCRPLEGLKVDECH